MSSQGLPSSRWHPPFSLSGLLLILVALLAACQRGGGPDGSPSLPVTETARPSVRVTLPAGTPSLPTAVPVVTSTPGAAPTAEGPPASASLPLVPTTPDARWQACEDGLPSRLRVGDYAFVSYDPYLANRVRTEPSRRVSNVIGLISPGEVVEILDGPRCFGQAVWWKVASRLKDLQGWTPEGDPLDYWLVPTGAHGLSRVPPSPGRPPCPVDDVDFCEYGRELESLVVRGDIDAILARTRLWDCPSGGLLGAPGAPGELCAYWGVVGLGGSGLDLTPASFIASSWSTYAPAVRRLEGLLLPPFPDVSSATAPFPASPAFLASTGDLQWDWVFSIDRLEEGWQVTALIMVSRASEVHSQLVAESILWP